MPHSMLDFPENEGDSRKLKKVEELVQHFSDQCRHYVPKQNIAYKHWWKCEIDYEEVRKKEKLKTVVCTNLKQLSIKFGVALCGVRAMLGKIPSYIQKRHIYMYIIHIWMSLHVSHIFLND